MRLPLFPLAIALALVLSACGEDTQADCGDPRLCPDATDGLGDGDGDGDGGSDGVVGCPLDRSCGLEFVDAATLEGELSGAANAVVVVDVRDAGAFDAGHLPGARHLPQSSLRAARDGIDGQVAGLEDAEAAFAAAGLSADDDVVLYDDGNGTGPARVAWTLQYYGHGGALRLLDGGTAAWTEAGLDLVTDAAPAASDYVVPGVVDPLRVDKAWVLRHLDDQNVVLVDARSAAEYDDGHIPGAISVDWVRNLGPDGRFLEDAELEALYPPGDPQTTFVTYCQTGSRASVDYAVLRKLGRTDVRIYDGSWAEWSADPDTPRE